MSLFVSKINPNELRITTTSLRYFVTSTRLNNNEANSTRVSPRVYKLYTQTPKRSFEDRNRELLRAHQNKRLNLAERSERPQQFSRREQPKEPKIVRKERKLPSLVELASPYQRFSGKEVEECQSYGTYFDPLFNPLLHEERHRVNPEEEPFNAIYADSETESSSNEFTKVRNVTTAELWSYVEQLAPIKMAPMPKPRKLGEPIVPLPSGYVPAAEQPPDLPYFIARTRNYLLPVYYHLDKDPDNCYTTVRQVSGDLWKLQEDLRMHLEKLNESRRRILTSVHEADERISFRGRYLHQIVSWLQEKGF